MFSARYLVFAFPLLACGGGVDTPSTTGASRDPSPAAPPSSSAPPPPSTTALAPPTRLREAPGDGTTPFHLVVANRSSRAGAIGVDVAIDGTRVVTGGFGASAQVTFDFVLPDGAHQMTIDAAEGPGSMQAHEELSFEVMGERWGLVEISTVRCDPCSPALIRWELRDAAPLP